MTHSMCQSFNGGGLYCMDLPYTCQPGDLVLGYIPGFVGCCAFLFTETNFIVYLTNVYGAPMCLA